METNFFVLRATGDEGYQYLEIDAVAGSVATAWPTEADFEWVRADRPAAKFLRPSELKGDLKAAYSKATKGLPKVFEPFNHGPKPVPPIKAIVETNLVLNGRHGLRLWVARLLGSDKKYRFDRAFQDPEPNCGLAGKHERGWSLGDGLYESRLEYASRFWRVENGAAVEISLAEIEAVFPPVPETAEDVARRRADFAERVKGLRETEDAFDQLEAEAERGPGTESISMDS